MEASSKITKRKTTSEKIVEVQEQPEAYFRTEPVLKNVIAFVVLHGLTLMAVSQYKLWTWKHIVTVIATVYVFGFSVTVGAHRLWAHRCYKAKLPFRIFLMLLNCGAAQNDIYTWSRDHRLHHKFVETDADPHSTTRGMFFAHMGWLMLKKHPSVKHKGRTIDCSDLLKDPVVRFQRKYYIPLAVIIGFLIPILIHWKLLGASYYFAVGATLTHYTLLLHSTWCINSLAHWFGDRPYDPTQRPADNPLMKWIFLGEGFHNYHHVFPFDYKSTEYPFNVFDLSALLIKAMAAIGQAYDLREASPNIIAMRKQKQKLLKNEHIF